MRRFICKAARPTLFHSFLISFAIALTVTLFASSSFAGSEAGRPVGPMIDGIDVGIDGSYKAGLWTPVEVFCTFPVGGSVELIVPDPDGTSVRYEPMQDITGPGGGRIFYVKIGRVRGTIEVRLLDDQGKLILHKSFTAVLRDSGNSEDVDGEKNDTVDSTATLKTKTVYRPAIASDRQIILAIGGGESAIEEAVGAFGGDMKKRPYVATISDFSDLPQRWFGYESVVSVVLSTEDLSVYESIPVDDVRLEALRQWVVQGGKLLVCVGRNGDQIFGAEKPHPLAQLVGGTFQEMVTLRQAAAFETYAEGNNSIEIDGSERAPWLRVPYLIDVPGTVEAKDGTLPLIVSRTLGFGQIRFAAVDLGQPPLNRWKERRHFISKLLGLEASQTAVQPEGQELMHLGYSDLAGQLRSSLDRFESVKTTPFMLVMGLIVLYVAIIGPLDYFVVHRLLKRPQLTWVTFPAAVVLFVVLAVVLVQISGTGAVAVHEATLVDVNVTTGQVRGFSWANVYSPHVERYDVSYSEKPARTRLTSWFGLTGSALGGMASETIDASAWSVSYEESPQLDQLTGVPMRSRSTRSFVTRWDGTTDLKIESSLEMSASSFRGSLMNATDFDLEDCILVYQEYAYELGDLEKGAVAQINDLTKYGHLGSLMKTKSRVYEAVGTSKESYRVKTVPYNQANADPNEVIRMLLFYRAADAAQYTGLSNTNQEVIDMSDLQQNDRAVLVGRVSLGETQNSDWSITTPDDRPIETSVQASTIYRFVLPVESEQ